MKSDQKTETKNCILYNLFEKRTTKIFVFIYTREFFSSFVVINCHLGASINYDDKQVEGGGHPNVNNPT